MKPWSYAGNFAFVNVCDVIIQLCFPRRCSITLSRQIHLRVAGVYVLHPAAYVFHVKKVHYRRSRGLARMMILVSVFA